MSYQSPGQYLTYERTSPPRQLDFGIADLSVSGRTQWLYCGPGEKKLCLHLVIPSGVTGAYTLETSNDGTLASGEAHEATATSAWTSAQPAGSGAHLLLDRLLTCAGYVAVVWTRASGGTGIVPTVASLAL